MDDKQRKALEDSILHWEENLELAREGKLQGTSIACGACACCAAYAHNDACEGCPIAAYTDLPGCMETPWGDVDRALTQALYADSGNDKQLVVDAVHAELNFLRKVLESGG
jgi:hypothetical protein